MFGKRVIGAIFVCIFTFFFCFFGGAPFGWGKYVLLIGLLLISLQGMFELYRAYKINKSTFATISYLFAVAVYGLILFNVENNIIYILIANILIYMTVFVFKFPKYQFTEVAVAFMGVFYVAVMISYIYMVRSVDNGIYWVWLIFVASWGSDVGAYTVGKLIGKHKIVPKLSPKKTVEGCLGGVAFAAAFGLLYALLFGSRVGVEHPYIYFAVIGAAGSVVSQIGDLAASAIKRQVEIKDYGKVIPGHGGILDRFDSVIYTAPLCYFLIQSFIK